MKTLKDINWNQVYYFYEVAKRLSMKEASITIGVSVPTVSEQIKKLEKLLNIRLFHRTHKKIELTNAGANLFNLAREMFQTGTRFLDNVSPTDIGGYAVRVGVQETISSASSIDFLTKYWDLFSPFGYVNTIRETTIEIIIQKLIQGKLDWAIMLSEPTSLRLESRIIGSTEIVFCCSPQLSSMFTNKKNILEKLPIVRSSWDKILNKLVDNHLTEINVHPEEIIETDHLEFAVNLCKRSRCVAFLPKDSIDKSSLKDSITYFNLGKPIKLNFFATWLKGTEKMISIKKLHELLNLDKEPDSYSDHKHQIKLTK